MLSYEHAYHIGNPADVLKHWVLSLCLQHLNRKPREWTYFDTHAGEGLYHLDDERTQRLGEWQQGVGKLSPELRQQPEFAAYIRALEAVTDTWPPQTLPGSPVIAAGESRAQDSLVLCERHPRALGALRRQLGRHPRVSIHERDGYEGILSQLPPASGRGLVLIDPSYELASDYERIPQWLNKAVQRWRQMMVAVWYPCLHHEPHLAMVRAIQGLCSPEGKPLSWLKVECHLKAPPERGLLGAGMMVVNPPWGLLEQLQAGAQRLAQDLALEVTLHHSEND